MLPFGSQSGPPVRRRFWFVVSVSGSGVLRGGSPARWPIEKEFFIDNLLVRIHFIIVMIRWTGLAPWDFEFSFPDSLTYTFLGVATKLTSHQFLVSV